MLSDELQEFLKEMFPKEAKRKVFSPEMKFFKNFGLDEKEVKGFLEIFIKRFNVRISENFSMEERFRLDEEGNWFDAIRFLVFLIPNIIEMIINWDKLEESNDLSFGESDKAIKKGVLE